MGRRRQMSREEQKFMGVVVFIVLVMWLLVVVFRWISQHILASVIMGAVVLGVPIVIYLNNEKFRTVVQEGFKKKFSVYRSIADADVQKVISDIQEIDIQLLHSEGDFEKQLYQLLRGKGYSVERQVVRDASRIDLVINSRIGLELKLAERAKNVQDLIGQVTMYRRHFEYIIVVIVDIGAVGNIGEFVPYIEAVSPGKIVVVKVCTDKIKRPRKKVEYIEVRKETSTLLEE